MCPTLTSPIVPNHLLPLHPSQPRSSSVTRTQTVEFAPSPQPRGRHQAKPSVDRSNRRQSSVAESYIQPSVNNEKGHVEVTSKPSRLAGCRMWLIFPTGSATFTQAATNHTHRSSVPAMQSGMGGFPMPHEIISSVVHKFFPNLERKIRRTVTAPVTRTLTSQHVEDGQQALGSRPVPYITFDALVGRNSTFHDLTDEQIEELCGVEFKALNCLVWIVPCARLHPSPCSPPTLITFRLVVSFDPPGHLVHHHCTIYVSPKVEARLSPSKLAFQGLTGVVRALQSSKNHS